MTDKEFLALEKRVADGESLPLLEQYELAMERRRRAARNSILESAEEYHKRIAANPTLEEYASSGRGLPAVMRDTGR